MSQAQLKRNEPGDSVQKSPEDKTAEYDIYVYFRPEDYGDGDHYWEKVKTTRNIHRAIKTAEKLYACNKYEKVEVKKKIVENNRTIGSTLRVYGNNTNHTAFPLLTFLFIIIGGFLAFAAGYFLNF